MPRAPRKFVKRKPARRGRRRVRKGRGVNSAYKTSSVNYTFPNTKYCSLTYNEEVVLQPNALGTATQQFSANSLFDPNVTGVGGQPRYFDTLCAANNTTAPYHRYLVHGCKATAYIRNLASVHTFYSMTIHMATQTAPSTLPEARMRPDTVVHIIPPIGSGTATSKLTMYRSMAKIMGVKDLLDYEDAGAEYNQNPQAIAYVSIVAYNPDGGGAAITKCNVSLTYYSMFRRLNDVLNS